MSRCSTFLRRVAPGEVFWCRDGLRRAVTVVFAINMKLVEMVVTPALHDLDNEVTKQVTPLKKTASCTKGLNVTEALNLVICVIF